MPARGSRDVEPVQELPVIPRSKLAAMLARDRAAASGGDAGGVRLKPASTSLVGHVDSLDRRETCPLHGWVGRRQFVEGGHAQCAALPDGAVLCKVCHGKKFAGTGACNRCSGTGVDPGDRGHTPHSVSVVHRDLKPDNEPVTEGAPS